MTSVGESSPVRAAIIFLALASAALFGFVFGNEADEMDLPNLAVMLAALVAIISAQAVGLLVLWKAMAAVRLPRPHLLLALAAAVLVASNAYFTSFITLAASKPTQIIMSVAAGLVLLLILLRPAWQPFARFMLASYFLLSLGLYAYTRVIMDSPPAKIGSRLAVKSTRNVYLIGNDSLHSPKALRDVYGVTGAPHESYLRSLGFRVLDSAYSAGTTTLSTYSRMFEFQRPLGPQEITNRAVFKSENATFAAFRNSGYKVQFIYHLTYFDQDSDLFDYTFPASSFSQCAFLDKSFFYFLCRYTVRTAINRHLFGIIPGFSPKDEHVGGLAAKRVRAAVQSREPWLTFYHHPVPFHTPPTYTYQDDAAREAFKRRYIDVLPALVPQNFETVIGAILKADPDAVIVTFGDHGAALTRGAGLDEPNDRYTPSQVIEDRLGVLLAVHPRDFCANRIRVGSTTTYLVESIIKCLNGDDAPNPTDIAKSEIFYWDDKPRRLSEFNIAIPPTSAAAP